MNRIILKIGFFLTFVFGLATLLSVIVLGANYSALHGDVAQASVLVDWVYILVCNILKYGSVGLAAGVVILLWFVACHFVDNFTAL